MVEVRLTNPYIYIYIYIYIEGNGLNMSTWPHPFFGCIFKKAKICTFARKKNGATGLKLGM